MNLPLAAANLPNRLPPPIDRRRQGKTGEPAGVAKFAHQAVSDSVPAAARSGDSLSRRSTSRGRSSTVWSMMPSGLLNVSQA